MKDRFKVVDDPVPEGTNVVERWGFFLDDLPEWIGGGFSTGEFLLRSDGVLLRRGVLGGDARDETTWRAGPWTEFHRFPAGAHEGQARVWLEQLDYQLGSPSPLPIDASHKDQSPT